MTTAANSSTESPFSINWRLTDPAGVECQLTMRAVKAETLEDILDLLDLRSKAAESMTSDGWKAATGFAGRGGGSSGTTTTTADPNAPSCECGVARVKKTGNGKKGPWAGWMCANRKCDPKWID